MSNPVESYWIYMAEPSCHAYLILTFSFLSLFPFNPGTEGLFSLNWMWFLIYFFLWQQPNFKQKFVALLKRFKVTDEVSVRCFIQFQMSNMVNSITYCTNTVGLDYNNRATSLIPTFMTKLMSQMCVSCISIIIKSHLSLSSTSNL